MKWLQFAWQNTLRNRRRSLVTVAIAALGTAAILLAGGFALFTYQALAQARRAHRAPDRRPARAVHARTRHAAAASASTTSPR
jgi:hypothetical protein